MNEWIEINLPWNTYVDYSDQPKIPDLSDREKEHFGNCEKELFIEWKIEKLREDLALEINNYFKTGGADYDAPEYLAIKNSPKYSKLKEFKKLLSDRDIWDNEQPEYIEYTLDVKKFYHNHAQKSFTGRELDKPGTLVEFATGKQVLIGTYHNDDPIEMEDVVKRYKIVWTPENENSRSE